MCSVHCLLCRPNRPLPNPVYECDYSGKESMALGNMTSNPSYMTAKDVVSTSFALAQWRTSSPYEVLPFEANEEGQEEL